MARADYDKWEPRYASGRSYGQEPNAFLTRTAAPFLPTTGTAVDLAGGSGRHALWLAARGLDVTVVDISPSGLALARGKAHAQGLEVRTLEHDLDEGLPDGAWDLVHISYFLVRPLLDELSRIVRPGGVLTLVHPTASNLERHPKPGRRWLFEDGELTGVPGLDTLFLEEGWDAKGEHTVRYVGRKARDA